MAAEGPKAGYDSLEQAHAFKAKDKNVLFIIERSKNGNVVVYEAKVEGDAIKASDPIDVYWQDIDPEYVKTARANGKMDDRNELNMIERKMAYGASAMPLDGQPGKYKVDLVAVPKLNVTMEFKDDHAIAVAVLAEKGVSVLLDKIYVYAIEGWLGPKVQWIEIYGKNAETGEAVVHRMKP